MSIHLLVVSKSPGRVGSSGPRFSNAFRVGSHRIRIRNSQWGIIQTASLFNKQGFIMLVSSHIMHCGVLEVEARWASDAKSSSILKYPPHNPRALSSLAIFHFTSPVVSGQITYWLGMSESQSNLNFFQDRQFDLFVLDPGRHLVGQTPQN